MALCACRQQLQKYTTDGTSVLKDTILFLIIQFCHYLSGTLKDTIQEGLTRHFLVLKIQYRKCLNLDITMTKNAQNNHMNAKNKQINEF